MTIAEGLIAQGREEGLAQGREEGRADLLSTLLVHKFGELPLEFQSRLSAASVTELETWALRLLTCASLDEVFADSH